MTVIEDRWRAGHDHDPAPRPDVSHDGEIVPPALFQNLAADGRFRRDSWWGRLLHPRTVSYREARATDSVHLVISDDKVSVHIDRFSPLAVQGGRSWRRYAPLRMLAHAVVDVAGEASSLVRGRHEHLHDLTCERVWVDDDAELDDADDAGGHDTDCGDGDGDDAADADVQGERVPFNVADEAVHLLDSEAEPSSVHIEARVAGRLDDGRLRAAVAAAVARHPLARARRAPFQWSDYQFQWQIDPVADADPLGVVDCGDEADLAEARKALQSVSVPLAGSPPLRVVLAHHRSGDVVMVNAHQAATDGFGALRFLRSVARAYAGAPDPVPDLDLLAARNLTAGVDHASGPGPGPGRSARARRARDVFDRLGDLTAPPARIAADGGRDTDGYGFHLVSLSQDETQALAGLDQPGTVTDVLLSALTLTIAGWNAEHGVASRRVSVLVPANLRPSRWSGEMVGNFSGPGRVSTRPQAWGSRRGTLAAVSAQSTPQRRPGMATALTEALGGSPLLPLWAKQAMSPLLAGAVTRLAGTAVFADLGTLDEPLSFGTEASEAGAAGASEAGAAGAAGEATAVHFSDPTHMPAGVSLGAVTAGGRLHLTFRHRHPQFDDAAAGRFADRFLAEVAALVADFRLGRVQVGPDHPEPDQNDVSQSA
ncbi:MAG: hypothetical protein ACR2GF_00870 [Acidimicrobiales bacterium]